MSLEEFILTNEKQIRMGFFFGVLAIMALWEVAAPRRKLTVSKTLRWTNNIGLVFFNSFFFGYCFRLLPSVSLSVQKIRAWGYLMSTLYRHISP